MAGQLLYLVHLLHAPLAARRLRLGSGELCSWEQPAACSRHLPAVLVPKRPPDDAPNMPGELWAPNMLGDDDGAANVGVLLAPAGVPNAGVLLAPNADALLAAPNSEGELAAPKPKLALLAAPNAGVLAAPKPNAELLAAPKAGVLPKPNAEALEAPPKGVAPNAAMISQWRSTC